MNNIEHAWFELGRAFSFLPEKTKKKVFTKLNLWMGKNSKFCREAFLHLANEVNALCENEKYTSYLIDAKELFANAQEVISPDEMQYYFFWGMNSQDLSQVLSLQEASDMWNLDDSTLRKAIANRKFEEHEYRKTGRNYILLKSAMERVYGEPNENK